MSDQAQQQGGDQLGHVVDIDPPETVERASTQRDEWRGELAFDEWLPHSYLDTLVMRTAPELAGGDVLGFSIDWEDFRDPNVPPSPMPVTLYVLSAENRNDMSYPDLIEAYDEIPVTAVEIEVDSIEEFLRNAFKRISLTVSQQASYTPMSLTVVGRYEPEQDQ